MDDTILDLEMLRALKAQAPTAEDLTALREFDGDAAKLGKASTVMLFRVCELVERFFKETMRIPRYTPRLDCMIFKYSFSRDVADLDETLDIINNACLQV
ncbi:unnamed protein product, partial [Discosporangium mesarthrocarpum]